MGDYIFVKDGNSGDCSAITKFKSQALGVTNLNDLKCLYKKIEEEDWSVVSKGNRLEYNERTCKRNLFLHFDFERPDAC